MAQYLDLAAATPVLKEFYGPKNKDVTDLTFKRRPFWGLVSKDTETKAGGKYYPVPVMSGTIQGASATFTEAQNNQTPNSYQEFLVNYRTEYELTSITGQAWRAAGTDIQAFLNTSKSFIQGGFQTAMKRLGSAVFRSGTGTLGQNNAMSTGVITLVNPQDAVQFEQGMTLQASTSDGSGLRSAKGYVIAVDYQGGTITVSATGVGGVAGNPTSWSTGASGDYLLQSGDSNGLMSGLLAWLPTTAPALTDSFYNVNRGINPTRLGGIRIAGQQLPIIEALSNATQEVSRMGGDPTHCFTSYASYAALVNALGSNKQFVEAHHPDADISYKGVWLNGDGGDVQVFPDRDCPSYTGFVLELPTWGLVSMGELPGFLDYDGNQILRVTNADAVECRIGGYPNLTCNNPGHNAVVTLPA